MVHDTEYKDEGLTITFYVGDKKGEICIIRDKTDRKVFMNITTPELGIDDITPFNRILTKAKERMKFEQERL